MVPVLDINKQPLMPCTEKRARKLMESGKAKPYWSQGIFCIILQKNPSQQKFQPICIAIDTGSLRNGITVSTKKTVVCNMLFNSLGWVKSAVEFRALLRKARRQRNTPYRKCRNNRSKRAFLPPSTKARWQAHIRIINVWRKLVPLTDVVIEDIKSVKKPGKDRWNKSFGPLEIGKKWFNHEIVKMGTIILTKFRGYETKRQRDLRGFTKTKSKLLNVWEAHNVDSHCLAEMLYGEIKPYKNFMRCDWLRWHRRQLHVANPTKGGQRKRHGETRTFGMNRGTLVRHTKVGLSHLGGYRKNGIKLYDINNGKVIFQTAKKSDLIIKSKSKWRVLK